MNPRDIVAGYKWEELLILPNSRLMALLDKIKPGHEFYEKVPNAVLPGVDSYVKTSDDEMLERWCQYLRKRDVPFAIMKSGRKCLKLVKERYV